MIINKSGIVIRLAVEDLRVMGRATQGVKLINLKGKDTIAAVAKVERSEEDDIEDAVVLDEEGNPIVSETVNEEVASDESEENASEEDNGKEVDNNDED